MKATPSEISAAAEAAISARQKATDAKAAADAAGGTDEALNEAYTTAEKTASDAETHALTLSQSLTSPDERQTKINKLRRKRDFIDKDLRELGNEEENDDDEDEDDQPLTKGEFKRMQATQARKTAQQMAEAIQDPIDRQAVLSALATVVASGDPEKDFRSAVAIANIDRNSKVLEEINRKPLTRSRPTGVGAPSNREEPFVPTAAEALLMRGMGLTKEAVLKARGQSSKS